jgi:hypothetical protein
VPRKPRNGYLRELLLTSSSALRNPPNERAGRELVERAHLCLLNGLLEAVLGDYSAEWVPMRGPQWDPRLGHLNASLTRWTNILAVNEVVRRVRRDR